MREAEARDQPCLTKLRLTKNVKDLIKKLFRSEGWQDAGQGWEGLQDTLTLVGWSRARRVVVLRRKLTGEILITGKDDMQDQFAFIEGDVPTARYEYAVLITSTQHEIVTLAQLYRDRADAENNFDELKNQWGWGGFTTQDLARCRLMARMVALVYNWWNLFVRLAQPHKHFEAITSRPLLLHGVATQTRHAGQTRLTIPSTHAKQGPAIQGRSDKPGGLPEVAESQLRSSRLTHSGYGRFSPARSRSSCSRHPIRLPCYSPYRTESDGLTAFFRVNAAENLASMQSGFLPDAVNFSLTGRRTRRCSARPAWRDTSPCRRCGSACWHRFRDRGRC